MDTKAVLEQVARDVAGCSLCDLHKGRTRTVPGEGSPDAKIMFIGEAPGFNEDKQGRPFVGQSGHFLDELLASIGLERSTVFITNVVKSRPPNNRDPLPAEIAACAPYLQRQIDAINPKMIVTLGRFSMAKFFPGESISRIHGQARRKDGRIYVPMYHPAAALHQTALKKVIEEDFSKLPELLATLHDEPEDEPMPPTAPAGTQLSFL
jgi:uracil-DNA glycosylase family 4